MSYTYVPGYSGHMSGPNGAITRIVIHATCSATKDGGAMDNAHYFQSANSGGLAHFVVDPHAIVQCCKEDTACWHAPPNHGSIGIELCDPQGLTNVQADANDPNRWHDAAHDAMLHLAAKLVIDVAHRNGVPLVKVGPADLKAGKHGICGHADVSQAFGQSDHNDPQGAFPWAYFMSLMTSPSPHPAPAPTPPPAHPAPAAPYHYSRTLQEGDKGPDVGHVQARLGIHVDGDFGPVTKSAVENFQAKHGLTRDGIVGPQTERVLG